MKSGRNASPVRDEFPPSDDRQYCSEAGMQVLRDLVVTLRAVVVRRKQGLDPRRRYNFRSRRGSSKKGSSGQAAAGRLDFVGTFGFREPTRLVILRGSDCRVLKDYLKLNLSLLYWVLVAPFRGEFFKLSPIFRQMVFIGVRAAPMVALTAFSVGVTLAMQAAHSLKQLGAEIYVPDLVMVTLLREMGPVLIAVIVIGRSGSAVAAELGTMKVSEEIEALEVMAINPIRYLVVPRFLAMLVMLPALTIMGDYVGVFGGWAVCTLALDFNLPAMSCAHSRVPTPGTCIPE